MTVVHFELSTLRRHWTRLAQIAVWAIAVLATFQMAPPRSTPAIDDASWTRLAQFVLVIILGLLIGVLGHRRNSRLVCRCASAALLLIGLAAFFINLHLSDAWTCPYDGRGPIVVGASASAEAIRFQLQNPGISCTMLVQAFAGNTAEIWVAHEIGARHITLVALYLANVLCLSLSLVLMLESLSESTRPGRTTS